METDTQQQQQTPPVEVTTPSVEVTTPTVSTKQRKRTAKPKQDNPKPKRDKSPKAETENKRRDIPYARIAKLYGEGKTDEQIAKATGRFQADRPDPTKQIRAIISRMRTVGYTNPESGRMVKLPQRKREGKPRKSPNGDGHIVLTLVGNDLVRIRLNKREAVTSLSALNTQITAMNETASKMPVEHPEQVA